MIKPNFEDAEAKLSRARKHISDVDAKIRSFLATEFYRIRLEPHDGGKRAKLSLIRFISPTSNLYPNSETLTHITRFCAEMIAS